MQRLHFSKLECDALALLRKIKAGNAGYRPLMCALAVASTPIARITVNSV